MGICCAFSRQKNSFSISMGYKRVIACLGKINKVNDKWAEGRVKQEFRLKGGGLGKTVALASIQLLNYRLCREHVVVSHMWQITSLLLPHSLCLSVCIGCRRDHIFFFSLRSKV